MISGERKKRIKKPHENSSVSISLFRWWNLRDVVVVVVWFWMHAAGEVRDKGSAALGSGVWIVPRGCRRRLPWVGAVCCLKQER